MLKALICLYKLTTCFIDGIGELQTKCGIRQGAPSSCYLFIIMVNDIIDHLNSIFGIDSFLMGINILIHADDMVILASSYVMLIKKLLLVEDDLHQLSLKLNSSKCKFMCFGENTHKVTDTIQLTSC